MLFMLSQCTQCESALDAHRKQEKRKVQENHEKHFCKHFKETSCMFESPKFVMQERVSNFHF